MSNGTPKHLVGCIRLSKNKRSGMLSLDVIILHDNASSHATKALVRKNLDVLEHPSYSPDVSPCDYYTFGTLKKSLMGRR
ncbi:hypothetical protein TNCV_2318491 [Trichonephila clavipes]|nr:hypothetical protein TNCV_2318491 [Trichonephila clavipes]